MQHRKVPNWNASARGIAKGRAKRAITNLRAEGKKYGLNLDKVPHEPDMRKDHVIFSESNSRFIIEVEKEKTVEVSKILKNVPFAWIGETTDSKRLIIDGAEGTVVDEGIFELKAVWQAPLKNV